jgi:hypothetical protein
MAPQSPMQVGIIEAQWLCVAPAPELVDACEDYRLNQVGAQRAALCPLQIQGAAGTSHQEGQRRIRRRQSYAGF